MAIFKIFLPHLLPQQERMSSAESLTLTLPFDWMQVLSDMASAAPKAQHEPIYLFDQMNSFQIGLPQSDWSRMNPMSWQLGQLVLESKLNIWFIKSRCLFSYIHLSGISASLMVVISGCTVVPAGKWVYFTSINFFYKNMSCLKATVILHLLPWCIR